MVTQHQYGSGFLCGEVKRVLAKGFCDIFNTDQGAQFASIAFTQALIHKAVKISMDGKGRAIDNVFVERLWRSVKYECVYLRDWETVKEAQDGLSEYFEFYNYHSPHQSLGGKTPATIYQQTL